MIETVQTTTLTRRNMPASRKTTDKVVSVASVSNHVEMAQRILARLGYSESPYTTSSSKKSARRA